MWNESYALWITDEDERYKSLLQRISMDPRIGEIFTLLLFMAKEWEVLPQNILTFTVGVFFTHLICKLYLNHIFNQIFININSNDLVNHYKCLYSIPSSLKCIIRFRCDVMPPWFFEAEWCRVMTSLERHCMTWGQEVQPARPSPPPPPPSHQGWE